MLALTCASPELTTAQPTPQKAPFSTDSLFLSLLVSPQFQCCIWISPISSSQIYWTSVSIFHIIYSFLQNCWSWFPLYHFSEIRLPQYKVLSHSSCMWALRPEWRIRNLLMLVELHRKLLKYTLWANSILPMIFYPAIKWLFHFWHFFMLGTYYQTFI